MGKCFPRLKGGLVLGGAEGVLPCALSHAHSRTHPRPLVHLHSHAPPTRCAHSRTLLRPLTHLHSHAHHTPWVCQGSGMQCPHRGQAEESALLPLATCPAAASVHCLQLSYMHLSSPSTFRDLAIVFPSCASLDLSCSFDDRPLSVLDDHVCLVCAVPAFQTSHPADCGVTGSTGGHKRPACCVHGICRFQGQ